MDVAVFRTKLESCGTANHGCSAQNTAYNSEPKEARGRLDLAIAGCEFACPIILAGGKNRLVSPWAQVGVHQVKAFETVTKIFRLYRVSKVGTTITGKSVLSEKRSEKTIALKRPPAQMTEQLNQYFKDMGISDELMTTMEATPNSSLHILSQVELNSTRLATEFSGPEPLFERSDYSRPTVDNADIVNVDHSGEESLSKVIPLDGALPQRAALVIAAPNGTSKTTPYLGTVQWRLADSHAAAGGPTKQISAVIDIPAAKLSAYISLRSDPKQSGAAQSMQIRIVQPTTAIGSIRDVGTPRMRNDETPLGIPVPSVRTKIGDLRYRFDFLTNDTEGRRSVDLIKSAKWLDLPLLLEGNIPAKITWEKGIPGNVATSLAYPSSP